MRRPLALLTSLVLAGCAHAASPDLPRPGTNQALRSPGLGDTSLAASPPTPAEPAPLTASEAEAPKTAPQAPSYPSCTGAPGAGNDCNGESCCQRLLVPAGEFEMARDGAPTAEKVHVNAFYMDKYEVTVGRIRAWLAKGQPTPAEGEVLYDDGARRPVTWPKGAKVQNEQAMAGWERYDTWTAGDARLPKNSISWYTAAAFCHFEGGRLPTEAEWKYAAVGGEEQRPYPWGTDAPTAEHAVFNCGGDGDQSCSKADILPVGSRPKGAGRFGHMDLAGSMFEWTLDKSTTSHDSDAPAVSRGGGFCYIGGVDRRATTGLKPLVYRKDRASTVSHMVGARCVYDIKP